MCSDNGYRTAVVKIVDSAPQRLVLQSGCTKLTLDKDAGKAVMYRKLLLWAG